LGLADAIGEFRQPLANGIEQCATDEQDNDGGQYQRLDCRRLARRQFVEPIMRLQLVEDELDLPAARIEHAMPGSGWPPRPGGGNGYDRATSPYGTAVARLRG